MTCLMQTKSLLIDENNWVIGICFFFSWQIVVDVFLVLYQFFAFVAAAHANGMKILPMSMNYDFN